MSKECPNTCANAECTGIATLIAFSVESEVNRQGNSTKLWYDSKHLIRRIGGIKVPSLWGSEMRQQRWGCKYYFSAMMIDTRVHNGHLMLAPLLMHRESGSGKAYNEVESVSQFRCQANKGEAQVIRYRLFLCIDVELREHGGSSAHEMQQWKSEATSGWEVRLQLEYMC